MSYNPNDVILRGRELCLSSRLNLTVTPTGDLRIANTSGQTVDVLSLQTYVNHLSLHSGSGSGSVDELSRKLQDLSTTTVNLSTSVNTTSQQHWNAIQSLSTSFSTSVGHNSRLSSLEYVLSRDGTNNVYLGQDATNIYIGSPNSTTAPQNIFLGTANDNVYISGTLVALQVANSVISDARITLNKGGLVVAGTGLEIEMNGVKDAATWTLNGAGEWEAKNVGGTTFNLSKMSNVIYNSLSTMNISVISNAFIGQNLNVVSNVSVGGQIRCIGEVVAFSNTCDARLKTDVVTISTALETVNKLRPVEFTWKGDITNVDRRNTRDAGFIAQEIHDVIPYTEMIMGPLEGVVGIDGVDGGDLEPIRGVRHERIIPYLVKAIQELTAEVSSLRARLSN